jgi:hypothetical protein
MQPTQQQGQETKNYLKGWCLCEKEKRKPQCDSQ